MSRARVLVFGLLTGVFICGYGVLFTVLDDFREQYGIQARWLGSIISIGFFTSFVAQLLLAPIADRGRARQMTVIGAVLNIAGLLVMAAGTALPMLLLGRFLSGLGTGMALPAIRRIVISADPDNIGNNLGLLFSADVTGFALGPAISAVLVPWLGLPSPFIAIAVLTAVVTVPALAISTMDSVDVEVTRRRFAFDLMRSRPLLGGMVMGSAVFVMIGTFDAMWAIVLDDLRSPDWIANLGVTMFALPLIFLGSRGGRLAQRFGPFRLGPVGILIGAVFMFAYGVLPAAWMLLVAAIAQAVFDGFTVPSAGVGVGMVAPADRQAGAQGLLGAAETLTAALTALAAGWLYDLGGRSLAYTTCAVVMVLFAGTAYWLAGPQYRRRPAVPLGDQVPDAPVAGHV